MLPPVSLLALLSICLVPRVLAASGPDSISSAATRGPTARPITAVGKLPALGWNTWNAYHRNIDEAKILDAGNGFVNLGLKAAGYMYVNIDDTWSNVTGRDPVTQRIVPDFTKFPDGINGTAAKIHAMGLYIGIYSDAGTMTCAKYPGSLGYEMVDAQTWSEWGIDYLKYDNCNIPTNWTDDPNPPANFDWYNSNTGLRYRWMTEALDSVSRPILYSLCEWGTAQVWTWGARVAHSWRMTGDASASWSFIKKAIINNNKYLDYVNFYAHNDMDMMEIGNGNLTLEEERTHFAAWAFMKSPILLGTNLSTLSTDQLSIVKNWELLAFHQDDEFGAPARSYLNTTDPWEFYSGESKRGTHVFVVNLSDNSTIKIINFKDIPSSAKGGVKQGGDWWNVHDMWSSQSLGTFQSLYIFTLAAHDTAAFLITKQS